MVTDHLVDGARINIELRGNNTVAVEVFIPGGKTDGTDLHETVETRWSIRRQLLTPTILVTTLWMDARSAIISSGWRVENQMLFTNPPSCSMEHWDPSIVDCRINAALSKIDELLPAGR